MPYCRTKSTLVVYFARREQLCILVPKTDDIEGRASSRQCSQKHNQRLLCHFDPRAHHTPTTINQKDILLSSNWSKVEFGNECEMHGNCVMLFISFCKTARFVETLGLNRQDEILGEVLWGFVACDHSVCRGDAVLRLVG